MRNLNNFLNNLLCRLKIDFLSENACPFGRFSSLRISFQTLSPRTIKKSGGRFFADFHQQRPPRFGLFSFENYNRQITQDFREIFVDLLYCNFIRFLV